jgi:hypothetical protein
LVSLKERHSEAGNRLLSSKKQMNQTASSSGRAGGSATMRSRTQTTKSSESEQAKLHRAERGWNNFSKKPSSHNYALGKGKATKPSSTFLSLAQTSQWNAQVDAVVTKTGSSFSPSPGKGGVSSGNNKSVPVMWNNFKGVLKTETMKWASARSSRHGNKIMVSVTVHLPLSSHD